jgi:hypothetical protein
VITSRRTLAATSVALAIAYKAVYESTLYPIEAIPNPSKIAEAVRARSAAFVGS